MSAVIAVPTRSPLWDDGTQSAVLRAWCSVVLLIYLGVMTLAAVQSLQLQQRRECGPFIIGKSAIGGCDWIG
jgi:hypothetical protein